MDEAPSAPFTATTGCSNTSSTSDLTHDEFRGFPILMLPRELRYQIWRFALVQPRVVIAVDKPSDRFGERVEPRERVIKLFSYCPAVREREVLRYWLSCHPSHHPPRLGNLSLFYVNRQVYQECLAIYYSENRFYFHRQGLYESFYGAQEPIAMLSFIGNTYETYGREITAGIRHIEFDLMGSPPRYYVESSTPHSSIISTLRSLSLQTLCINAIYHGLYSFIRLCADCFPRSTLGKAETFRVKWAVVLEEETMEWDMTGNWQSFCRFAHQVRLLRNICLGVNRKVGYAGITVYMRYNRPNKKRKANRISRMDRFLYFWERCTWLPIITFEFAKIDEATRDSCALVSNDVRKDVDRSHPIQHRDLVQFMGLLKQNGSKKTLDLANWSPELEKFEREYDLSEEFAKSYGRIPMPPQWPPITWEALSLRW